jgi:hypothetical protein
MSLQQAKLIRNLHDDMLDGRTTVSRYGHRDTHMEKPKSRWWKVKMVKRWIYETTMMKSGNHDSEKSKVRLHKVKSTMVKIKNNEKCNHDGKTLKVRWWKHVFIIVVHRGFVVSTFHQCVCRMDLTGHRTSLLHWRPKSEMIKKLSKLCYLIGMKHYCHIMFIDK